jgi:hypothetical protein
MFFVHPVRTWPLAFAQSRAYGMGTHMGDSMARQYGKLTALVVQRAKQRGYLADGGGL